MAIHALENPSEYAHGVLYEYGRRNLITDEMNAYMSSEFFHHWLEQNRIMGNYNSRVEFHSIFGYRVFIVGDKGHPYITFTTLININTV